ncbi:MAG: hypothetical protein RXR31_01440 [Thermoproteota archaeon]|jgi:hypothetical protein
MLASDNEQAFGGVAKVELSDGAILLLKVMVVHIKEAGFSPFGGVNFDVKALADVTVESLPDELKEKVRDKPVYYPYQPYQELLKDGWEFVDIKGQWPAVIETTVNTSKGTFRVKVVAEVVMVARNLSYKTPAGEPIYTVSWIYKVSWTSAGQG